MESIRGSGVVVVGGGLIGCAVARAAALEGRRVTLLEAGRVGRGASRAAAGMLAPLGEVGEPGPFLALGRTSLSLYPSFVEAVRRESGIDPAYLPSGRLHVAFGAAEEEQLSRRLSWVSRFDPGARIVAGPELREFHPSIARDARAALLVPGDHQVDNRLLMSAVVQSATRAGVTIVEDAVVREIVSTAGVVSGVALEDGREVSAGAVVLAAGAGAGGIRGLGAPTPVVPVRGQMAALGPVRGMGARIVEGAGVYLVPRRWGRILVGATVEHVGFRNSVTPEGIAGLLRGARRLVPGLGSLPATEVWAGLRPGTPDDLPILGPDPALPGLLHAGGHYRNGILLAPITARILADLLAGRDPGIDLAPFHPRRFLSGP
jgi:glycine oxidase